MWQFILLILLFFVFLLCFLLFLDSTMISNLLTVHSGQAHIAYRYESFRDFLFKKCHLWCVNFCNLNSLSQVHPCDKSSLLSVSMLHLAKLCLCKWKRYKVLSEVGDKGMPSGNWCDAFRSLVRKKPCRGIWKVWSSAKFAAVQQSWSTCFQGDSLTHRGNFSRECKLVSILLYNILIYF